jgi:hypothetical protein
MKVYKYALTVIKHILTVIYAVKVEDAEKCIMEVNSNLDWIC